MDAETRLDLQLSAICTRNKYTHDPGPVIEELRRVAGDRADVLASVAGGTAGFYRSEHTATLCDALEQIPGAAEHVPLGRARAGARRHGTAGFA